MPQDRGLAGPQYRTQNVLVEEIALGGNLSASVRMGDTVRRRAGPWTPAVHALLAHFGRAGFPAPAPLGFDAHGRAMLAFLPGDQREVFDTLPDQSRIFADFVQREADAGDPGYAKLAGWHLPDRLRAEADLLTGQRDHFVRTP